MKNIPIRKITAGQKDLSDQQSFRIRTIEEMLNGNDLVHELHRHDFFFILFLQKGEGTHAIDFITYSIHDNSIFFLRPGQVHRLELKANCTGYLMEFGTTFYHPTDNISTQRLRKASNKNFCELNASRFKKLQYILQYILYEFNTKETGYLEVIKANLDIFFIEFIRQSGKPHNISKDKGSYSLERLDDLLELLKIHITNAKQASQYADMLNLSVYQLNAITKGAIGISVSELINQQIILEAKRYLLATSNQVKEIADLLGYEDVSYFIRFFKKHTGYTPEIFRKNFG